LNLTAHEKVKGPLSIRQEKKKTQTLEEHFKYLTPDHEVLQNIFTSYDIDERFPHDRFLVRNADGIPAKKIYYTTALSKEILTENENKGIKFVHAGVTMFVKQEAQSTEVCRWRIQTEGLQIIAGRH
jgi:multisite-specific tRNA:(cytosine-C5)-methyltransferase